MSLLNEDGEPEFFYFDEEVSAPEEPNALELIGAGLNRRNIIGRLYNNSQYDIDKSGTAGDFNPFTDGDLKGYEDHYSDFIGITTAEGFEDQKRRIDDDKFTKQVLEDNGIAGAAVSALGDLTDPTILVPVLGAVTKASRASNILRSAAAVGGSVTAVETGREAFFHANDTSHTVSEGAINVLSAATLGGLLGGAVGAFKPRELAKLADAIENGDYKALTSNDSAGAAKVNPVDNYSLEDLQISGDNIKGAGSLTRLLRAAGYSESKELLYALRQMVEIAPMSGMEKAGETLGASVESTTTALIQRNLGQVLEGIHTNYADYVKRAKANGEKPMSFDDFDLQVGKAHTGKDLSIPEANAAAAKGSKMFDDFLEQLTKYDLIDQGIPGNYWRRVFDVNKVAANSSKLTEVLAKKLLQMNKNEYTKIIQEELGITKPSLADLERFAKGDADKITNTILTNGTHLDSSANKADFAKAAGSDTSGGGFLKARKLDFLDDDELADFLMLRASNIYSGYAHSAAPKIALAQKGITSPNEIISKIVTEYTDLIKAAEASGNTKKVLELKAKQAKDVQLFRTMYNRVAGINEFKSLAYAPYLQDLRKLVTTSMLGQLVINATVDIFRPMAVHGFKPYARVIKGLIASSDVRKLQKSQARKLSVAWEHVLNTRLVRQQEGLETNVVTEASNRVRDGIDKISDAFGKYSLARWWNNAMKSVATTVGVDDILRTAEAVVKGDAVDPKRLALYANMGMDKARLKKVHAEWMAQVDKERDGLRFIDPDVWGDEDLALEFQAFATRHANEVINTPTKGNQPLIEHMGDPELMRSILQFKSFNFASYQQTMLKGLQQHDANFFSGMLGMVMMGAVVTELREIINSTDPRAKKRPELTTGSFLYNAIDKSGIVALPLDAVNIAGKITGIGASRRYFNRSKLQTLLGPSAGVLDNLMQIMGETTQGEFDQKTLKHIRQFIPFQNLFYMKWLFDTVEKSIREEI